MCCAGRGTATPGADAQWFCTVFQLRLEIALHSKRRNKGSVAAERCFNCKNVFLFLLKPDARS